jgi:alkylhydroperoxidase family enzyme
LELGEEVVDAALQDFENAPLDGRVKAALRFIVVMTLTPGELQERHFKDLHAAGLTRRDSEDAIQICAAFNIIARIADALAFEIQPRDRIRREARVLLKRGYRI